MLPCLDRLSVHGPANIGEFYELSDEEAAALNADGGKDPLTYDAYPANRPRGSEGATFRIFWNQDTGLNNPPGHEDGGDGAQDAGNGQQGRYAVYDAATLWDWHSTHPRDPYNTITISHGDWMELYQDYGQNGPIPDFVATLPRLKWPEFGPNTRWVKQQAALGDKWTWLAYDADGALRFKSKWRPTDQPPSNGLYYEGPKGEERKWRLEMQDQVTKERIIKHYAGSRDNEYVNMTETPWNGVKKYYNRSGYMDKVRFSDGRVEHYMLYPNGRSLIHTKDLPNGTIIRYAFPDRRMPTLLNAKRKMLLPNGNIYEYKGGLNREYLAKVRFASGNVNEFEGNKGEERMVKTTFVNGGVREYKGNRGEEYKVKERFANGMVYEYRGNRGEERLYRAEFPDGRIHHYEGPKGSERVAWEETPDGQWIER